jgi:hypothetical protein
VRLVSLESNKNFPFRKQLVSLPHEKWSTVTNPVCSQIACIPQLACHVCSSTECLHMCFKAAEEFPITWTLLQSYIEICTIVLQGENVCIWTFLWPVTHTCLRSALTRTGQHCHSHLVRSCTNIDYRHCYNKKVKSIPLTSNRTRRFVGLCDVKAPIFCSL